MVDNLWLSKTSILTYLRCPYKWKLQFIDKKEVEKPPSMERGIHIHKCIENFYQNLNIENDEIKNCDVPEKFLKFENKRLRACKKKKDFMKYFKPLYQELKLIDEKEKIKGIVDAIFINPENDEYIVIDWKSGKSRFSELSKYRLELSIYKMLVDSSGILDKPVRYWGIVFVDEGRLFFEKVKKRSMRNTQKVLASVREKIQKGEFECKVGILCKWCPYIKYCREFKDV